jgi:hypothetical protein
MTGVDPALLCGVPLVVPVNRDGDILMCREPEAHPDFVANVTKAICALSQGHWGDHASGPDAAMPLVTWSRGRPTGMGWPVLPVRSR